MSEQLNIFVITRSLEMHKFTAQFVFIHEFLTLLATMMQFSEDQRLKELFHSFSMGFMPQTVFFLAQATNLYDQSRGEQLAEQFALWDEIHTFHRNYKSSLRPFMTKEVLINQLHKISDKVKD